MIQAPAEMIAIIDFYWPLLPPRVRAGGPRVGVPHPGGLQFLLCDGHVEFSEAARFAEAPTRRRWNNDDQPHDQTW